MSRSLRSVTTRPDPRLGDGEVLNNAGGVTFEVTPQVRLRRFLILGAPDTYYTPEKSAIDQNVEFLVKMANGNHDMLRSEIATVSEGGLASSNEPALLALAIACSYGTQDERRRALEMIPSIARTGAHLLIFTEMVQNHRGWGRALRRGISDWYQSMPVDRLAYQTIKYRHREGWSQRDVLRLAHPVAKSEAQAALYDYVVRGTVSDAAPVLVHSFEKAKNSTAEEVQEIIASSDLSWEMLPDEHLTNPDVWRSLISNGRLPLGALIRQLPRLTRLGVLEGEMADLVVERLTDQERIRYSRLHPMAFLKAAVTYWDGRSVRGSSTWTPNDAVAHALNEGFHLAFDNVQPAGKRTMIALDVSGSMGTPFDSTSSLTCREASAAMAMITMRTEPKTMVLGFTAKKNDWRSLYGTGVLTDLGLTADMGLKAVVRAVSDLDFGGTDCALPMIHALENGLLVDTFVVYTDNETWAGKVKPYDALVKYREETGIPARLVVVGMTATGYTIANPDDAGMLDVVGFDSSAPAMISAFSRGDF